MTASIDRTSGDDGVLYAFGTENAGLSLFVQDDRLVFDYNAFGEHAIVVSEVAVPDGASVVGVGFRREATGAIAELSIDSQPAGSIEIPFVMRVISSVGASVGFDAGSAVSDRYNSPFAFTGSFHRLDVVVAGQRGADSAANAAAERATEMGRQ